MHGLVDEKKSSRLALQRRRGFTMGDGRLMLYKYGEGGTGMYCLESTGGAAYSSICPEPAWAPGEWHHLVGVWDSLGLSFYVDGKLAGKTTTKPLLSRELGVDFRIGDEAGGQERKSSSLIERVRVYDKALPRELIEAYFQGDYNKTAAINNDSIKLGFSIDPEKQLLLARATYFGPPRDTEILVSFAMKKDNEPVGTPKQVSFVKKVATAEFSLAGVNPGDVYELSAVLVRAGDTHTPLGRAVKMVRIPNPKAWAGNRLGLDDQIPVPWTPLKVSGIGKLPIRISCWGREYTFGTSALPDQIESKGESLLARPLTVKAVVDGGEVKWNNEKLRVAMSSESAAEIQSEAKGVCAKGDVWLKVRSRIEYDGLVVCDVDLQLPDGARCEELSLDIPVRSKVAMYCHRFNSKWGEGNLTLSEKNGCLDSTSFVPFAWLGDNERGLFWFCESAENWPDWESKESIQIIRDDHGVAMRFNILAPGQTLKAPWRYRFGLQATPVKPMRADLRTYQMNIATIWPHPSKGSMSHFGYPEANDPEVFQKSVDSLHAQGKKVLPYSCLSYFSEGSPEWFWFQKEWLNPDRVNMDACSDVVQYGEGFQAVCPTSKSFSDFIVWKNIEFLKKFGLDGFYHDNAFVWPCKVGGCGWTDAKGERHVTYPVLATRDLYRRLYKAVKNVDPDAILMGHMSGYMWVPLLAYEDAYLDGESYMSKAGDSYMDIMPLDAFRTECMGHQWGLRAFFLPEFDERRRREIGPTRELAAILILHDVAPYFGEFFNVAEMRRMYAPLEAFGYGEAEFIPYFDSKPLATTEMKGVYISVYKRPDHRALVVVANLSKEDRTGKVSLNEKRIGFTASKISDWDGETPVSVDGASVSLSIPKGDCRLLLIEGLK